MSSRLIAESSTTSTFKAPSGEARSGVGLAVSALVSGRVRDGGRQLQPEHTSAAWIVAMAHMTTHQPCQAVRDGQTKTCTLNPGTLRAKPFEFLEQPMALHVRDAYALYPPPRL